MTTTVDATDLRPGPEMVRHPAKKAPVPRRILVATGPLCNDEPAITVAAALAAGISGAELVVAGIAPVVLPDLETAVDRHAHWARNYGDEQEALDQMMRDHLCEVVERLPAGVRVRTVLDWGSRTGGLLHACQEERPDLVVVPHLGGGPLRRVVHNHATRAILRHADVPVLVVPVAR